MEESEEMAEIGLQETEAEVKAARGRVEAEVEDEAAVVCLGRGRQWMGGGVFEHEEEEVSGAEKVEDLRGWRAYRQHMEEGVFVAASA